MSTATKHPTIPSTSAGLGSSIRNYLELIRFSHTIFALPFALLASVWAWTLNMRQGQSTSIAWLSVLGILVCMVAARSFAMAVNRLADTKIDAINPRTANRHLPSGRLRYESVVIFASLCASAFVIGTLLFLPNRLPLILAVPVLLFLAGYSFAKRFTVLVHFWLGIALGLAPICAWIALRGDIVMREPRDILPAFLVGLSVLFWVAGFDLIYACQDAEVDRKAGMKSMPAWLGIANALRVAALCHSIMLVPVALTPWLCPQLELGRIFWAGLFLVAILLCFEHSVVSPKNLEKVNVAFFQANAVISLVILVTGIADAWIVSW